MADPNPTTPAQVIDFMREQFARVHQRFDKIDLVLSEHGARLQRVEREIVNLHSDYAMLHKRLDNVSERLERIERRLHLVDG